MSDTSLTLDQLRQGQRAEISALQIQGANRRRLLDLGLLPGTEIVVELVSPLGDPVAYRVRGSVIALRREQSRQIAIRLAEPGK